MGDLNKQQLGDIWKNSLELKKLQATSLDDFPRCKKCPDIHFCGMSLDANANENPKGDPFIIPKHFCTYAEAVRKLVHAHHKKQSKGKI